MARRFLAPSAFALLLAGCATPHLLAGDALTSEEGGEYRESEAGVVVSCAKGLRWTGPMSDKAAAVALELLKATAAAAP